MSNLIELIQRNEFLEKIFPDGVGDSIFFGQMAFDVGGKVSIGIHTKHPPKIEVKKWGAWGVDYNVVVINLVGKVAEYCVMKNYQKFDYAKTIFEQSGDAIFISQPGSGFDLQLVVEYLIFQNCTTYIESA